MEREKKLKAGGVVSDGKNIYVVHRNNRSIPDYSLPKGHCEDGETFKKTAIREVGEETGILGEVIGYIDTVNYSYIEDGKTYECEVQYFAMRILEIKKKMAVDDVDNVIKCPIDEVEKHLTYDLDKEIIKKWKEKYYYLYV